MGMKRKLKPKTKKSLNSRPEYPSFAGFVEKGRFMVRKNGVGLMVVVMGAGLSGCEVGADNNENPADKQNEDSGLGALLNNIKDHETNTNDNNNQVKSEYSEIGLPGDGSRRLEFGWEGEMFYSLTLYVYDNDVADYIKENSDTFMNISDEELLKYPMHQYHEVLEEIELQVHEGLLNAFRGDIEINDLDSESLKAVSLNIKSFEFYEELGGDDDDIDYELFDMQLPAEGSRFVEWDDWSGAVTYRIDLAAYGDALVNKINSDAEQLLALADNEITEYQPEDFWEESTKTEVTEKITEVFRQQIKTYGLDGASYIESLSVEILSVDVYDDIMGDEVGPEYGTLTGEEGRYVVWEDLNGAVNYKLTFASYWGAYEFITNNVETFLEIADKQILKSYPEDYYLKEVIEKSQNNIFGAFVTELGENGIDEWELEQVELSIEEIIINEDIGGVAGP